MSKLVRETVVPAPVESVWRVLADFGNISAWVPLVGHSCLLSEQTSGPGTVRRVQIARQALVERVTEWDEPRTLTYSIEGLPPMVGTATNRWRLDPAGAVTEVNLTTEIVTGPNPAKRIVAAKALERMAIASDAMLAGLAAVVTTEEER